MNKFQKIFLLISLLIVLITIGFLNVKAENTNEEILVKNSDVGSQDIREIREIKENDNIINDKKKSIVKDNSIKENKKEDIKRKEIKNIKDNNMINVYALIKGTDGTYYNYLNIILKNDNKILCKGMTRQYFKAISPEELDGIKTDIKKVSDNGLMKIQCLKSDILTKKGKIKPNIKVQIISDGFYNINNGEILLKPSIYSIKNNMIFIGNLKNKNIRSNFKIEVEKINNVLFNRFDKQVTKIKEKLEQNKMKNEKLKKQAENLKEVLINIKSIPNDIKEIKYQYNGQKHIFRVGKENKILSDSDTIDYIKFGEKKFYNLKLSEDNVLNIDYDKDFNKKPIELTFKIKNLPKIYKDLNIYIDGEYFDFKDNKKYILNQQQERNGIRIKIGNKEKLFKIDKSDEIELDYNYFIKDKILNEEQGEKEDSKEALKNRLKLDNTYLAINLPYSSLDGLGRVSCKLISENGSITKKTILKKDIFIDTINGNELIIDKFISLNEPVPNKVIIKGKTYNIKDIALNYQDFIKIKYDR